MSRLHTTTTALACLLLLAGCATAPPREPLPPAQREAAVARQAAREAVLADADSWSLDGRIALSNHGRGGSGSIEWQQHGDAYTVSLAAPITGKSWRLVGEAGGLVRLEGLDGGTRTGRDATALLRAATGWEIPVAALVDGVRGARAEAGGEVALGFTADGRLARLEQDGWTLDYDRWQQPAGSAVELPTRINAGRGEANVRLVIDHWWWGSPP